MTRHASLEDLLNAGDFYAAIDASEAVLDDGLASDRTRAEARYVRCLSAMKLRAADTAYTGAVELLQDGALDRSGLDHLKPTLMRTVIDAALRSGRRQEAEVWMRSLLSGASLATRLASLSDGSGALDHLLHAEELSAKPTRKLRMDIIDALIATGDLDAAQRRAEKLVARGTSADSLLIQANVAAAQNRLDKWSTLVSGAFGPSVRITPPALQESIWKSFRTGAAVPAIDGPSVTVVMTTHNAAETVSDAIRSVDEQTYKNIDLVVVDDCSSDETRALVEEWTRKRPRIRLISNRLNVGTYVAKNRALRDVTSEYITFHDADDYMLPDRVAEHVKLMSSRPDLLASMSEWVRVNGAGHFQRTGGAGFAHPNPASIFMRRAVLGDIGYFDAVRVGADSEFGWRMRRRFGVSRVKLIPATLGIGLSSATSLTANASTGYDRHKYSRIRLAYGEAWFAWHRSGQPLYVDHPLFLRKFPAPTEIVVLPPGTSG